LRLIRLTGWIASRRLSSGAHSRDPVAHDDGVGSNGISVIARSETTTRSRIVTKELDRVVAKSSSR